MEDATIKNTFIQNLKDLFESLLGEKGVYKTIWYGDPVIIDESQLPGLVIDETGSHYVAGPTMMDQVDHDVLIQVVLNKKDELGAPKKEGPMSRKMHQLIDARDSTTNKLLPTTIVGILRGRITLNGVTVHQKIDVAFGVVGRPNGIATAEGHISVSMTELMYVDRTS